MTVDIIGNRTVRDLLGERARLHPGALFLRFEDRDGAVSEYTYADLLRAVRQVAAGFDDLGVRRGDAVVVHLPNCPEFLFCWLALAWLGAVAVPANTANTGPEMAHVLGLSEAVAVVTTPELQGSVLPPASSAGGDVALVLARTGEAGQHKAASVADWLAAEPRDVDLAPVDCEDVAQLIFTSGTTSLPKAVMLTHANYLRAGERESRASTVDERDRLLTALPLFHVNAQSVTVLSALTVGASVVLLEEYRASRFWAQVRAHDATHVSLVAMQLRTLQVQPPGPEDRDHRVRRNTYAINVTTAEKEAFEERFGLRLMNGYGLSEAMTMVTATPVFGEQRWPSIGLPVIDRVLRIVNEVGEDVPAHTPGQILVGGVPGRTLMRGYFRDPAATAEALRDGWLHTGDNGWVDELGYLYFLDRGKDVIKRAGENVSSSEVEMALLAHEAVAEVAVVGIPDAIRDEAVKAVVVLQPGAEVGAAELLEHCAGRLARFKVPTVVEFRESLPKTSIGKIQKKLLREENGHDRP